MLENVIGVNEASLITGLAEGTIKNYCADGKLPAKKIGKTWVLDKTKLKEMFGVTRQIKQAMEFGLSVEWVKIVTGEDTESAAIETLAEMYKDTDLTVEQFVFEKLQEDGRVKDDDAFDDESEANAQGYYWFDNVGKWIDLG